MNHIIDEDIIPRYKTSVLIRMKGEQGESPWRGWDALNEDSTTLFIAPMATVLYVVFGYYESFYSQYLRPTFVNEDSMLELSHTSTISTG